MANESFRDILAQFLEEKTSDSPLKATPKTDFQATFAPETPLFHWQNPSPQPSKKAYVRKQDLPPIEVKVAAPVPKPAAKPEPKWLVSELNAADQKLVKSLVQMGANDLANEISLSSLKKAHRKLARTFHPDMAQESKKAGVTQPFQHQAAGVTQPSHHQAAGVTQPFIELQSIYERLKRSLQARASESACGNGSASAAASQRQDAA